MTTTELAIRELPAAIPAKIQYAKALAESGLLPAAYRKQPANVLYAIEYGEMLGLSTMAALTGVHVIEGKPSASAGLISALVRRAGHKLRIRGDAQSATCQIVRSDDPGYTFEVTFTIEDAKAAKLTEKDVWKKYAASMLKARAITQCARDACEEALFGLHYTPEELGEDVDYDGTIISQDTDTDPDPDFIEPAWFDEAIELAGKLKSEHAAAKLWREAAAKADSGEITADDAERIQAVITGRVEQLRQDTLDKAMRLLREDEPWRAKIEELGDDDDARAALEELGQLMAAGTIDQTRGNRISRAIVAKFPRATAMDREVA